MRHVTSPILTYAQAAGGALTSLAIAFALIERSGPG